jgi:hypothetical protein
MISPRLIRVPVLRLPGRLPWSIQSLTPCTIVKCCASTERPTPQAGAQAPPKPKRVTRGRLNVANCKSLCFVSPYFPSQGSFHFIAYASDLYSCTDDVIIQFARSSGAGGQNVNKVNTKVDMRLRLDAADWIAEEVKAAVWRMVRGQ